jgi:hypothetical protein
MPEEPVLSSSSTSLLSSSSSSSSLPYPHFSVPTVVSEMNQKRVLKEIDCMERLFYSPELVESEYAKGIHSISLRR